MAQDPTTPTKEKELGEVSSAASEDGVCVGAFLLNGSTQLFHGV